MSELDFDFGELWPVQELPAKLPPPPRGKRATSWVYRALNLNNDPARRTLRSVLVGRYRYCCDRWLREYLEATNPTAKHVTPGQRTRRQEKVKKALAEAGL